jgi:WD40 repeat protein
MHGHLVDVIAGKFSADGSRILSAGSDGIVKLWDAGTAIAISAGADGMAIARVWPCRYSK